MQPYQGNSIVDYLNSLGQASDFNSRKILAISKGIQNYTGAAEQNLSLLNMLRTPQPTAQQAPEPVAQPVQQPTNQPAPQLAPQPVQQPTAQPAAQAPQPTPQATPQPAAMPVSTYTGSSVVDYLKSIGQGFDFGSRKELARQYGIGNYAGTASQNTQLLEKLRSQSPGIGSSPVESAAAALGTVNEPEKVLGNGTVATDSKKSQFQQDIENVLSQFGISAPAGLQSPQSSFSDVYKQVYDNLGLSTIKAEYDDFSKQFSDLQNKKSDEALAINNDPWLTEGVRVERLRKLDEKYEGRETNLSNRIRLLESMYDNGRQDAQFVASGMMNQFERSQELTESIIMKAIDIAEKRAEAESALSFDPIEVSPGATLFDPTTGQPIFTAPVKPTGNGGSGGGGSGTVGTPLGLIAGDDGYVDPYEYARLRAESKLSPANFDKKYGYLVNPISKAKFGVGSTANPTNDQTNAAGYATRAESANGALLSIQKTILKKNPVTFQAELKLPNYLQSPETQQYLQAVRNFITAQLRKESGAAISTGEITTAIKQYFPMPGDSDAVIAQKAKNRIDVINALKAAGGSAYQPTQSPVTTTGKTSSGLNYVIR